LTACERYIDRIQEAVDGTLGSIRRADLEMHMKECDACRALYDDLMRVRDAGAALPVLDPPGRAWLQIAGRLRQEGRIREVAPAARRRPSYAAWLAAAAALVIAAGGFVLLLHRSTPPTGAQTTQQAANTSAPGRGNAAATKSVETVESEVDAAQSKFEDAISNLEKVTKANQSTLDPATSRTINKNLDILDQAIAENRAAVKAEPASVAARETLFEALRQKVSLLQDTIALINEMRKGNNAAAAQLLNKS
jgi:anti-sigma factor RsiW